MSKKSGNGWSLNKISFWALTIAALVYLLAQVFRWIPGVASAANWVGMVASAIMLCIVAILAWRYVRGKGTVWMVLYFIVLLIAIAFIILPCFAW